MYIVYLGILMWMRRMYIVWLVSMHVCMYIQIYWCEWEECILYGWYLCIHVCLSRYIDANEKNVYCMAGIHVSMYVYIGILFEWEECILYGRYLCIHVCISRYIDVNEKNVYGMAGLHVACRFNIVSAVSDMLRRVHDPSFNNLSIQNVKIIKP